MIKNNQLKIFFEKIKANKLLFILLLSTFLIFLSAFCNPLIYVASAVIAIGIIFLSIEEIFCIMFYILMFSRFLIPLIATFVVGAVAIIVRHIIDLKKKKIKTLKSPLILTCVISILFSFSRDKSDFYSIWQGIMIIAILFFIYLVIIYRKQINIKKCFDFLFIGLITSIVISAILYLIPNATMYVFDSDLGLIQVNIKSAIIFKDGENFNRLNLLVFHVNHLSAFNLFAIAYSALMIFSKHFESKRTYIYYGLMFIVNLVVGTLTLSKAFLVVFVFEIVLVLIYYISKHKKKAFEIIGIGVVVIALITLIFGRHLINILDRFITYNYDTLLGMITTGRSAIWQQYVNAVLKSPAKLLFGFGLFSSEQVFIGPHNIYIFLLYRFGLLGILLLGLLVYFYVREINTKIKFDIKNCLIFITFLVIGLQEACIDERLIFFVIGILVMLSNSEKKQKLINEK